MELIERRALRIEQTSTATLYLFSLAARDLSDVADVSRISRDDAGRLIGYQRGEKKQHIQSILDYLDSPNPLFPNAIIMALPSTTKWRSSRGPTVSDGQATSGSISVPVERTPGLARPALVVDGQQRWRALSKTQNADLAIPIAGFVTDSIELQRDQFLRVNNVKPLPIGLVTELLPEVSSAPSPRLSARRLPSALVDMLNTDEESPFRGLIRRASSDPDARRKAVVTDTVLVAGIEESLNHPSGCLFPHRNMTTGTNDTEAIRNLLITYWTAVSEVFSDAWALPPKRSRLMHGVGIRSMSRLMDRIMPSTTAESADSLAATRKELERIAPLCRWTSGTWEESQLRWNDVQNVPKHISVLSNYLIRSYVRAQSAR